jgi:hypothetical protein
LATVDYLFPISFKRVGRVIELYTEQHLDEVVGQPIENQLRFRVIYDAATPHETAPKDAVVALVEFLPVTRDVARIIRFVGHRNDGGVAGHVIHAARDSTPKAVRPDILHRPKCRNTALRRFKHAPRCIRAAIVHHDNFVCHIVEPELDVEMLNS